MTGGNAVRERLRQAWRDVHEAVYYAANAAGCAQFVQVADHQARRGDAAADIEVLRCIQRLGRLTGDEAQGYRSLHATYTLLMRSVGGALATDEAECFIREAHALEARVWSVVPAEQLPGGMFTTTDDPASGQLRLARRVRRGGELAL